MKSLLLLSLFLFPHIAMADKKNPPSLKNEFQTLGDNKAVMERVNKLDSQQKVRIVQNRLVSRTNRIELAINYGALFGGEDSYVKSSEVGGMLQYHINPSWSFGGEFQRHYNSLTSEGTRQYDEAYACQKENSLCTKRFSGIDYPIETQLATVSYYPIYGKLNLFDSGIAQFDLYTTLGYGVKKLNSGNSNTLALGLGVGVWINDFFTTRFELRYENYKDMLNLQERNQNAVTAMISLGVLVW